MGAKTVAAATLLVGALWSAVGQAAPPTVPMLLTEQGRLTDSTGTPITTSTKLTFKIYTTSSGGSASWTEKQTVTPSEGYFSLELGSVTALPLGLFTGAELYLGVTVDADPEMKPRQPITSVPYAFISDNAIGDITPNSITTTGGITTTGALSAGSGVFSGGLAANGGLTVGGTTVIDAYGNWVGPLETQRPFVGWSLANGSYYCYYGCYGTEPYFPSGGGTTSAEPGSFTPNFNGTCLITATVRPQSVYGTVADTDYMYAYPYVNGSAIGYWCFINGYAANGEPASCTAQGSIGVSSGTGYSVGCYGYASGGYGLTGMSCSVSWVCTP